MAEGNGIQPFTFEQIELCKGDTLGTGSYGVVCKAKCDHLLCAAKIIYPVLFEVQEQTSSSSDKNSHRTPYRRFEQECHFLSQINHPNIVQYIQTYRDPETGSAVLLMELMDESLTHFLQTSRGAIPTHVQVTICHNVVLALSFLHSNGIIHRDLSSNNILLNDGIRAKVTDFGMSMFMDTTGSRTLCPGTVAYMPPEALNEPPVHTDKLDCFSFGCCVIQISTRLWPDPKPRFSTYQVPDPRNPTKTTPAQLPVPERERRASHIDLIDTGDILLQIALDCLKDIEDDRPSAAELCVRMEALKECQEYKDSVSSSSNDSTVTSDRLTEMKTQFAKQQSLLEGEMQRLRTTVEEAHKDIRERNQMLVIRARQLQKVSTSLAEKERENDRLQSSMVSEGDSKMRQDERIGTLELQLERLVRDNSRLQHQLEVQDQTIRDQQQICKNDDYQLRNMEYDLSSKVDLLQRLSHQLTQATILIEEKERLFLSKKREARHLEELLQSKMNSFQDSLKSRDQRIQDLEDHLSAKDEHITALQKEIQKSEKKVAVKEERKFKPKPTPRQKKDGVFVIRKSEKPAPAKMHAGSSTSINSSVYMRPYNSKDVYEFNADRNEWSTLPECPESAFALASCQGNLTTVGGRGSRKIHNLLNVDGKQTWAKYYPEMTTERASACAVSNIDTLIVAGGLKSDYSTLSSVEVLNFNSYSWSLVASLPYPLHSASATVCGDHIYLGGGYYMKSRSLYSILTCSLPMLLATTPGSTQKAASLPRDASNKDWFHISNLPICCSTFTSFHGGLVAVGGKSNAGLHSNAVYKFNRVTNSWEEVAHMSTRRSSCLVGSLQNKIVVVGGYCDEGMSSEVEVITA